MDPHLQRGRCLDDIRLPLRRANVSVLTLVELLVVIAIIGVVVAILLPGVRTPRANPPQTTCRNNLKQIALAVLKYSEDHGELPPAYTTDADGRPLHSWRTLILPYVDQIELYESIDFTKPWDDPVNAHAAERAINVFQCPSNTESDNRTTYLAVVTPESCFRSGEGVQVSEITDPAKETMMVIEVESKHAIPWMSPSDADEKLVLTLGEPTTRAPHPGGAVTAFVDGSVQFLSEEVSAAQRRAMISIAGNDSAALEGAE